MPQFFTDQKLVEQETVRLTGSDAKHIAQVLRLMPGDSLILSSGDGRSFNAKIETVSRHESVARILDERLLRKQRPSPVLAQAIIKHDRTEWIIQKAIELGVTTIIPFTSERTIPQFADSFSQKKQERWNAIALAAAKQSGLPFIPQVERPQTFEQLTATSKRFTQTILLFEGEQQTSFQSLLRAPCGEPPWLLIIGPEGGFAPAEIKAARNTGMATASLGPQILRVETAALTAVALCQYELGNMELNK